MSKRKRANQGETGLSNWLLLGLLVILFGFAFLSFLVLWKQRSGDTAARETTTQIQIEAQSLARYSAAAAQGNLDAFDELTRSRSTIANAVADLSGENGYPQRAEVAPEMTALVDAWRSASTKADRILSLRDVVLDATAAGVETRRNGYADDRAPEIPRLSGLARCAVGA